jgi:hypothetical protein
MCYHVKHGHFLLRLDTEVRYSSAAGVAFPILSGNHPMGACIQCEVPLCVPLPRVRGSDETITHSTGELGHDLTQARGRLPPCSPG